jgi:nucleoside-diphosphate-sugar epimerase
MKKIIIVGSEGYLGSLLVEYLTNAGYECVGFDLGFFKWGVLRNPLVECTTYKSASELTEDDLNGAYALINLASISNDPFGKYDSDAVYSPAVQYSVGLGLLCKKCGLKYILPSSCSVYGISDEESDEGSLTNPQTGYSRSKIDIEVALRPLVAGDFRPIVLRLATVFGASPRIRFDLVINMMCGMAVTSGEILLNSNGLAWRPHLDIRDVCRAFEYSLHYNPPADELFILNVGSESNNLRIIDVAELVSSRVTGSKIKRLSQSSADATNFSDSKIRDGVDVRNYRVSFRKIRSVWPDFGPFINVTTGVQDLINHLEKYGLDGTKLQQRDFFRLQRLDYLVETRQLPSGVIVSG